VSRAGRLTLGGVVVVTAMLVVYVALVVVRALDLIGTRSPVGVALGAAFLVFPLLVVVLLVREWRLAVDTQRMADLLAAADGLAVDDLPRSAGGRVDKDAARAAFDAARAAVEADPQQWQLWFRLAFAYEAVGDRSQARASLRTASGLWRADYSGRATPEPEDDA
jgi:hypothetical protein